MRADGEPGERGWRDLQRRGRQHQIALLRTDPDDGAVLIVAVAGDAAEPVVRLYRDQLQVDAMLDAADRACIQRAREAAERRP